MPDEINLNSSDLESIATKYKSNSFKNNKDGNSATLYYLLNAKITIRKLKELMKNQFRPKNPSESFKEIQEQIHSLCGDVYFSNNRFGSAIDQYEECLKINSGNIHAIVGLANSYQSLGLNDLAREKYDKSKDFYSWEKTFLDKNAVEEQNSNQDNPDDADVSEFQYLPKGLLFNMAITEKEKEKSKRMFEHIANSEPSPDCNESYIFVEFREFFNSRNAAHFRNVDTCAKLEKEFSQIKIDFLNQNKINLDSKNYKVYAKKISTFVACIAIPEKIIKSKKIAALYFQYSLDEFSDDKILQKILKNLNIKLEYNEKIDKQERKFLDKQIFKFWLKRVGYEKSLLSMDRLDDVNPKQIIDNTILTHQIIKALNQAWQNFEDNFCIHIKKIKTAKILTESLEDYVQLYYSNPNVREHDRSEFEKIIGDFKDRLEALSEPDSEETNQEKQAKIKKSSKYYAYSDLLERIDKLQRQIQNAE
jgi:hypothetical protein